MKRHLLHCAPRKFKLLLLGRRLLLLGEFFGYFVLAKPILCLYVGLIVIVTLAYVLEAHYWLVFADQNRFTFLSRRRIEVLVEHGVSMTFLRLSLRYLMMLLSLQIRSKMARSHWDIFQLVACVLTNCKWKHLSTELRVDHIYIVMF